MEYTYVAAEPTFREDAVYASLDRTGADGYKNCKYHPVSFSFVFPIFMLIKRVSDPVVLGLGGGLCLPPKN